MKFEYTTSYLPIDYFESGDDSSGATTHRAPIVENFVDCDEYFNLMNEMGEEGWELVSVQSILKGAQAHKAEVFPAMPAGYGYGFGYSITDGFMLFWKRGCD